MFDLHKARAISDGYKTKEPSGRELSDEDKDYHSMFMDNLAPAHSLFERAMDAATCAVDESFYNAHNVKRKAEKALERALVPNKKEKENVGRERLEGDTLDRGPLAPSGSGSTVPASAPTEDGTHGGSPAPVEAETCMLLSRDMNIPS